jgi:hypothetical protein
VPFHYLLHIHIQCSYIEDFIQYINATQNDGEHTDEAEQWQNTISNYSRDATDKVLVLMQLCLLNKKYHRCDNCGCNEVNVNNNAVSLPDVQIICIPRSTYEIIDNKTIIKKLQTPATISKYVGFFYNKQFCPLI